MRRSLVQRVLGVGIALAASASLVLTGAPPAHAATNVIALAGSDTTQDVMAAIVAADGAGTGDTVINIRAGNFQSSPVTIPADDRCSAFTYHNKANGTWPTTGGGQGAGELPAPDGSSEGRDSLARSIQGLAPFNSQPGGTPNGCIDVARSSGARRAASASELSTFQYFAFAVDGVMWGTTSMNAPGVLTQSQLQGIYNCTYTDWSQVGGSPGPIQRVLPQNGSGTLSFSLTNLLGVGAVSDLPAGSAGGPCFPIVQIQENQFYDMFHGSSVYGPQGNRQQYANSIGVYSAGKFSFQAAHDTNPTIDTRAGFRPGQFAVNVNGTTANVGAVTWSGAWKLNNQSVVGLPAASPRSEQITTTAGSNVITLTPSTHNVTVGTTNGSRLVTGSPGTFTQNDIGSPITTVGDTPIPASSVVTAISSDGSTATLNKSAIATQANPPGVTATLSSHFTSFDAGATLSGNGNIPASRTITFVLNNTSALISDGTGVTAGGPTATTITPVGQVKSASLTSTATSATVTGPASTFAASDVGHVLQGPNFAAGTTITGFTSDTQVTVSPPALTTGTASTLIGFSAISEGNVFATNGASAPFPGARFVFNVLDPTGSLATYTAARDHLVGYDDIVGGNKSPLCSGAHDPDQGGDSIIGDNGFIPIHPHTSAGGNVGVTCYKL